MNIARALFDEVYKKSALMLFTVEDLEDEKLKNKRIKICEACPEFKKQRRVCSVCSCFIDIKAGLKQNRNPKKRGRIEITHCPLGKWFEGEKEIANYYRQIDGLTLLK